MQGFAITKPNVQMINVPIIAKSQYPSLRKVSLETVIWIIIIIIFEEQQRLQRCTQNTG